jgi:hypothetical protein
MRSSEKKITDGHRERGCFSSLPSGMLSIEERQNDEGRIRTFDLPRAVDEAELNCPMIARRR